MNSFKIESVELLNTIKYNYGKLINSNCADISEANNRIAICTEKCIFIINLNMNWPRPAAKYVANYRKLAEKKNTTTKATIESTKQSFNIDSWIQDLQENKNELLFLNLIQNVIQSYKIENIYREFLSLKETIKRKSFHRLIREQVSVKDKDVIESNLEQYLNCKHFVDQTKLFDTDIFDYLSFLNPINNPNQNQDGKNPANKSLFSYFYYGFKYCKWNRNPDLNLLCVITACNQLLLFDCTFLTNESRDNNVPNKIGDDRSFDSFIKVYDKHTKSKFINLSHLCLSKPNEDLFDSKSTSIHQFYKKIKQILPTRICWSKPIKLIHNLIEVEEPYKNIILDKYGKQIELLFVALKSSEIVLFLVYLNNHSNLEIELISKLDLDKLSDEYMMNMNLDDNEKNDEYEDESRVPNMLTDSDEPQYKSTQKISSISFFQSSEHGILSVGLTNGEIQLIKLNLKYCKARSAFVCQEKIFIKRSLFLLDEIERIQLIEINSIKKTSRYLLIAKKEHTIDFFMITYENESFQIEKTFSKYHVNACDDQNNTHNFTNNHIIKNPNKIVDFKVNNIQKHSNELFQVELLIWFENSNIKFIKIEIKIDKSSKSMKTIENSLINNSVEISFNLTQLVKNRNNECFKVTRNIFVSSNNSLIIQLNEFNKLELIERKITQIELNIYRIKPYENLIQQILPTNCESSNENSLNDLIWLLRRQLYLNKDYYDHTMFCHLNSCLKIVINKLGSPNISESFLVFLKLIRMIIFNMMNYLEITSYFNYFESNLNENVENEVEEEKEDEQIYSDSDSNQEDTEIETTTVEEESNDFTKNLNTSSISATSELARSSSKTIIIKSAAYFSSILRDLNLALFKFYSFRIINFVEQNGLETLTEKERIVYALFIEFSIKKNFFAGQSKKEKKLKDFLSKNRKNLFSQLSKCDLCGKSFKICESSELSSVRCDQEHIMNRCEKSLLPLNNFKFIKCKNCNSVWNYFQPIDYPNINRFFGSQINCLFCVN